ncbi:MAG: hypothetical protein ACERNK_15505, partial [Deltaproteobacteria bacterium]
MSNALENQASWALETAWVVLAIATHALFLGVMPKAPMGSGAEDPLDTVAIAIVDEAPVEAEAEAEEEAPEPEEPAEPEPVKPPPKPKTFKAPKEPPKAP